ncbi:uncharacterized protein BDZ99DRAFT_96026 [Mytilinidion resinicola]|uniref:Uncharacterized protein n=1 Tax=Mytilinidion resinicola TaxID=574789 RepID=A0A6A6YCD2_9PEZI|nr:uncharacterized protein BDZ99DRAFT_96026 [Mytilinidion resinicola]KAF2806486.1 hypothetical protein BDZ99DRAFT_96026 [Mytilinidion resinicola]
MASESSQEQGPCALPTFLEIANAFGLSDETELLDLMTTEPVRDSDVEINTNFLDAYAIFRDLCLPRQSTLKDAAGPGLWDVYIELDRSGHRKESQYGRETRHDDYIYSVTEHYARFMFVMMEAWDSAFLDLLLLDDTARWNWLLQHEDQQNVALEKFYDLIERIRYHYYDGSG